MKKMLCAIILLISSSSALSDNMQFSLSNDMVEAAYQANFGKNYNSQFKLMHADEDNEDSNTLSAGLFASNQSGRWTSNLGGKFYWLDAEKSKSYGIGLGGSVAAAITPIISLGGALIISPDIINGGDYETFYDAEIRADFKVMQHASLFIAYRLVKAEINSFDLEAYNGGAIGFKFDL